MGNNGKIAADTEAMALAIGKFIWKFNELDDRLLGNLLDREDVAKGEIVGAALMFRNKCNLIKALVHHEGGMEATEGYKDLDARLKKLNEVRNHLAHGEQWVDFDGTMRQHGAQITDKGYRPKHSDYSPDAVFTWVAKVADLEAELWRYSCELLDQKASIETAE